MKAESTAPPGSSGPGERGAASSETSAAPWTEPASEVIVRLESDASGLGEADAVARLARFGPNALPGAESISRWRILFRQFRSPLVYVLLGAMIVTAFVGDWADVVVIALVVIGDVVIGYFQEYRAENAMRALLKLVAASAVVLRDGHRRDIAGADLVPGDVVLLEAGDIVPADLRMIAASNLRIDESLLTGESVSVAKSLAPIPNSRLPVAERRNMAFSGTSVVSGHGNGIVVATGGDTEVGRIAVSIRGTERGPTPLQDRMTRLGRVLTIAVIVVCAIVFGIGLAQGRGASEMFLTAVAVGVSAIPEGLPIVMTVALAVGIRRMAARNAVIRRLPAVETLGSCSVILTDKTGTLTENRMTVRAIWSGGRHYEVTGGSLDLRGEIRLDGKKADAAHDPPLYHALLGGTLPNEASLLVRDDVTMEVEPHGDPTEAALLVAARKGGLDREILLEEFPLVAEVPFESERLFSASTHRDRAGNVLTFAKGAPERIVAMSDRVEIDGREGPLMEKEILDVAHRMAADGMRVLAVARGVGDTAADRMAEGNPGGLRFLGLFGMIDPPREEAITAVAACRRAGIRVIVITGDHATTAAAVAAAMGIADGTHPPVLTGSDIDEMPDDALASELERVSVFARMSPAQKLRIVELLKERGEIVAVTGDGVNDAPALKSAHIGAAMGRSGTDVARESADLVVADDNFAAIYAAVEEGRIAFSNIRNATFFLVGSGTGEILLILTTLVAGLPLPILPAQILWLNVVTNGIQDVALAFDPGDPDLLSRPPRPHDEGILSRVLVERSLLVGLTLAAGAVGVFVHELNSGRDLAYAQVAVLTMLVLFEMIQLGNSRSETLSAFRKSPFSNPVLLLGAVISVAVHIGAMYWGPTQSFLRLQPLSAETWIRLLLISLSVLVVVEIHKVIRRPSSTRSRPAHSRPARS